MRASTRSRAIERERPDNDQSLDKIHAVSVSNSPHSRSISFTARACPHTRRALAAPLPLGWNILTPIISLATPIRDLGASATVGRCPVTLFREDESDHHHDDHVLAHPQALVGLNGVQRFVRPHPGSADLSKQLSSTRCHTSQEQRKAHRSERHGRQSCQGQVRPTRR